MKGAKLIRWIRPLLLLIFITTLVILYSHYNLSAYVNVKTMRSLTDSYGSLAPLFFIGFYTLSVLLHMPQIALVSLGVILFGGVEGFIYGFTGIILGANGTFLLSRYAIRDLVQHFFANRFLWLKKLDNSLQKKGFYTVLILRLVLFLAPPLNSFLALTKVRFSHFLSATFLGIIPGMILTCYFADSIVKAESFAAVFTPKLIIFLIILIPVIVMVGIFGFRFLQKESEL